MPGAMNSVNALYAVGQHDAIGFSPFSIESLDETTTTPLTQSYDLLKQLMPLILEHQGKGEMAGLLSEGPEQRQPQQLRLGGYVLNVTFDRPVTPTSNVISGGLVIASGPGEFVFAGTGLTVTFEVDTAGDPLVGLLAVDEGEFKDGQWQQGRRLNGDQTHQGRHMRLLGGRFGLQRVKLYRYR